MAWVPETDLGVKAPPASAAAEVSLDIDGQSVTVAGRDLDHARGRAGGDPDPQAVRHRHAGGVRLLPPVPGGDRRPPRLPGFVHHAGRRGHEGPHPDRTPGAAAPRGDGALHLRPSAGLPDLRRQRRLRTPGHGRGGGPARGALRLSRGPITSTPRSTPPTPYFAFDPTKCVVCSRCVRACDEVQGTFALTIAGRGLRLQGRGQPGRAVPHLRVRVVRRLRPGLPHRDPAGEKSLIEIGPTGAFVITTCAYCGVGCVFKAEMRGEELVRMVPWKDGKANHGHSCVKGRFAWGYATHRDRILKPMIRARINEPWREVTLGRGHRPHRRRVQAHPEPIRPRLRRRRSPPRAAPTKRPSWSRSWCARRSATTTSTPARGSAIRPPAMG